MSLLDQLAPDIYFPLIFFYKVVSDKNTNPKNFSSPQKKSLTKTLTHCYSLAGRAEASDTSKVQKTPEMDSLDQILPFKPHELKLTDQVNLRVQINYFDCGGVVIGVC
ncbi:hypothetical protein CISIN_1g044499mg [Citrus sinensis]|uniref:Uncharacterized protein n=1 Tax=Citrus sinensis TaxID=2711 RepID=A0A067D3B5_CITSI|nr:hypothetical protein CISIN_1g044499mg [Citrus sinensis]